MNQRPVSKGERSIFFTRVDALRPSDPPLGVEPAADNNVMKVTADCLFMRTAFGSMYGGRRSMSWWAAVVLPFIFAISSVLEYVAYVDDRDRNGYSAGALMHYLENWGHTVGDTALVLLCFSWIFIPWRTQLPIIFNRKTRQVTCVIQGKWVYQSWDHLEAYIKDVTTFAVGGAPVNEGVLTLAFPCADPDRPYADGRLRIGIAATKDADEAFFNRGIYGAAMVWEYIRLYMQDGMDALPPSSTLDNYRATSVRECVKTWDPFRMFQTRTWWKRLLVLVLFPVVAPFLWLIALGDIFYMWLDRILPRRKWPKELIDACDGVWDGGEN
ncbi:hypothetical protein [Burkholderia sp. BCC1999]|uniref:hypothetical protein n=1 Tax=Burkholderia sp. BCC1999 TaxID=2817448 RepID=UPI002AC343AA|nr:hypothetical protein [Burkholderia sp. BCC1999]